jgi:hypothetical protein
MAGSQLGWKIVWNDGERQWSRVTTLPTVVWLAYEDEDCIEISEVKQ